MKKILSYIITIIFLFTQSNLLWAQSFSAEKSSSKVSNELNLDNLDKAFYEQKAMRRLGVQDTSFMQNISPLQKEALINREKDYDRFYNLLESAQKAQDAQDAQKYLTAVGQLNSLAYKYYLSKDDSEIPSLSIAILNASLAQGFIEDKLRADIEGDLTSYFNKLKICRKEGCALDSLRAMTFVLTDKKISQNNETFSLVFEELITNKNQKSLEHLAVLKSAAARNFGTLEEDTSIKLGLMDASLLAAGETGVIETASSIINAQSSRCRRNLFCEEKDLPIAVINRIGTYGESGLNPLLYFADKNNTSSKAAFLQANLVLGAYYKDKIKTEKVKSALKDFYCTEVPQIKDAKREQQTANQIYLVYDHLGGDNVFGEDEFDSQGNVNRHYYTLDKNGAKTPYRGCVVQYRPTVNYLKQQNNNAKRELLAFGKFSAAALSFLSLEVAAPVIGWQLAREVKGAIKDKRTLEEVGPTLIIGGIFTFITTKPLIGKWAKIAQKAKSVKNIEKSREISALYKTETRLEPAKEITSLSINTPPQDFIQSAKAGTVFAKASKGNLSPSVKIEIKGQQSARLEHKLSTSKLKNYEDINISYTTPEGKVVNFVKSSNQNIRANNAKRKYPSGLTKEGEKTLTQDLISAYGHSQTYNINPYIMAIRDMSFKKAVNLMSFFAENPLAKKTVIQSIVKSGKLPSFFYDKAFLPVKAVSPKYINAELAWELRRISTLMQKDYVKNFIELKNLFSNVRDFNFKYGFSVQEFMTPELIKNLRSNFKNIWGAVSSKGINANPADIRKLWYAPLANGESKTLSLDKYFTQFIKTKFSDSNAPFYSINSSLWGKMDKTARLMSYPVLPNPAQGLSWLKNPVKKTNLYLKTGLNPAGYATLEDYTKYLLSKDIPSASLMDLDEVNLVEKILKNDTKYRQPCSMALKETPYATSLEHSNYSAMSNRYASVRTESKTAFPILFKKKPYIGAVDYSVPYYEDVRAFIPAEELKSRKFFTDMSDEIRNLLPPKTETKVLEKSMTETLATGKAYGGYVARSFIYNRYPLKYINGKWHVDTRAIYLERAVSPRMIADYGPFETLTHEIRPVNPIEKPAKNFLKGPVEGIWDPAKGQVK